MTNKLTQTDMFSLFGIEDQYAKEQEEARKKREKQQAEWEKKHNKAENKGSTKKEEPFLLEQDTIIYFYNEEYAILDFFTKEELEMGLPTKTKDGKISYNPISKADVKKRLANKIPVLTVGADLIYKTFKNKPNVLVVTIQAKKKGNVKQEELSIEDALPSPRKIPFTLLHKFISISKHFSEQHGTEVHGDIYYDTEKQDFSLSIPSQVAHRYWVVSKETEEDIAMRVINNRNEIKVMEIHSHHVMSSTPSAQDDESETCPILYAIIGNLNNFFPDITVRTYDVINQQHIELNPFSIFEQPLYDSNFTEDLSVVEIRK